MSAPGRIVAAPLAQRGVTLLELLVALVIVAVLAAIAVPSYRSHVLRARRTDATAALLRIQGAQEKFFVQNARYADELTAPPPDGLGLAAVSDHGAYDLRIELGGDGLSFVASAEPRPGRGQADDAHCRQLSIDHNGLRTAHDVGGNERTEECWR